MKVFNYFFKYWLLFLSSGTLVKVVYLVRGNNKCMTSCSDGAIECHTLDGTLCFVKFETKFLNQWIQFLHSQRLFLAGTITTFKLYFLDRISSSGIQTMIISLYSQTSGPIGFWYKRVMNFEPQIFYSNYKISNCVS